MKMLVNLYRKIKYKLFGPAYHVGTLVSDSSKKKGKKK
jgi:hypothetical protein